MLLEPPFRSHGRLKPDSKLKAFSLNLTMLHGLVIALLLVAAVQADLESGRKLAGETQGTVVSAHQNRVIKDVDELYAVFSGDGGAEGSLVNITLPPGPLLLPLPLIIKGSAIIRGSTSKPVSVLRCSEPSMSTLIEFSGSSLQLSGVQLERCAGPGLHITNSSVSTFVTIESSVFSNFVRSLDGRENFDDASKPTPISDATKALAIHAANFAGTISIKSSKFVGNVFKKPEDYARRLFEGGGRGRRQDSGLDVVFTATNDGPRLKGAFGSSESASGQQRRGIQSWQTALRGASAGFGNPLMGQDWEMVAATSSAHHGLRELQESGYKLPLLEKANVIHPVETGPWADDVETAVSILCGGEQLSASTCSIKLSNVNFIANQGAATGAMYVLCDGGANRDHKCDVEIQDGAFMNNSAIWQDANNLGLGTLDLQPDRSINVFIPGDYGEGDPASYPSAEETETPEAPGIALFNSMIPWLTYTYPLLTVLSEVPDFMGSVLTDAGMYPTVTGRTLGALVFHQKNSPAVGALPSEDPMMTVRMNGTNFSANDGSAVMSTATDFTSLAGGDGTWAGSAPRHSADFLMTRLSITKQNSSWPAIWLRWARSVSITGSQVTNSTGAIWLDEVRDSATVEDGQFVDNKLSHLWLDTLGFMVPDLLTDQPFAGGASHVVKIQMTALGDVPNSVSVKGCRFRNNVAFTTGVLYMTSGELPEITDADIQPGLTTVTVTGTSFTTSTCLKCAGSASCLEKCVTGERPLRITIMDDVTVQGCRFWNNAIGGLFVSDVKNMKALNVTFDSNQLTCTALESQSDNAYGGAGLFATRIGSGGFTMSDLTFRNNSAYVGGGGIFLRDFLIFAISNSRFESNTAQTFEGGALWLMNGRGLPNQFPLVDNCTFESNSAGFNGGAISARNVLPSGLTGLMIQNSNLTNNTAMVNPNPDSRGSEGSDQFGGGAVYAYQTSINFRGSYVAKNKVRAHAGGGLRVVDSLNVELDSTIFQGNLAIMGGAVAVTRLPQYVIITSCEFKENSAVHPWAWPDTSPVSVSPTLPPKLSVIDPGYGGAVYATSVRLVLSGSSNFTSNTALFGGAVACMSVQQLFVGASEFGITTVFYNATVPSAVAQDAAGLQGVYTSPALPYLFRFEDNTALLGGAFYVYDTTTTDFSIAESTIPLADQPLLLFLRNTANGGAAVYLEDNGQVNLARLRCVLNKAIEPPLLLDYTGLYGREKYNASAKTKPCFQGGGGGICVVGQAAEEINIKSSEFLWNGAHDGAGIHIAEGIDCSSQAGCYGVTLESVNMRGNNATGRGGGVFWMHEGVLSIASCPSDTKLTYMTDGKSLLNLTRLSTATNISYSVTLVNTTRKGPATAYGQLTVSKQAAMLSSIGGTVPVSRHAVRFVQGSLVTAASAIFATSAEEGAAVRNAEGQLVTAAGAMLTETGVLTTTAPATQTTSTLFQTLAGSPVVLDGALINDTAWSGVPYDNLACGEWRNVAGTGEDISTTPYFLMNPPRLDFYTSNTDIKFSVSVHDWLGNQCTGNSQPLVIVQAESPEVSGAVQAPVQNGSAAFTSLRLRAKEGLHNVNLTGQLYNPFRELIKAEAQIYVRPCAFNEFLSPKNLDECIPCDVGSYNLNVSAVGCQTCPDNTNCAYPDPGACKSDSCKPTGFMVPQDGYWHASFFSEEVLECPNSDSCTFVNRSDILAHIQLRVWQAARAIQLNASDTAAAAAAAAAMKNLLANRPALRRMLQEKAINDTENMGMVLNVSLPLLADYNQNLCAEGYTGTLCGECMPGYGWRRIATCAKCPSKALNNLYYALVTFLTLSMLAFTIYSSLKEQRRPGLLVGGTHKNKQAKVIPAANGAARGSFASAGAQFSDHEGGPPNEAVAMILDPADNPPNEQPAAYDPNYEYVDPVLAAARGHYASAPGTPRNMVPAPFPVYDPALRAHSVVGMPMRSVHWGSASPNGTRRPPPHPWSRVEYASGSYTAGTRRPSTLSKTTNFSAGPVAEARSSAARPGQDTSGYTSGAEPNGYASGPEAASFTSGHTAHDTSGYICTPTRDGPGVFDTRAVHEATASFTMRPNGNMGAGFATHRAGETAASFTMRRPTGKTAASFSARPMANGGSFSAGRRPESASFTTARRPENASFSAVRRPDNASFIPPPEPTGYTNILYDDGMNSLPPQPEDIEEMQEEEEDEESSVNDSEHAVPTGAYSVSHPHYPNGLMLQSVPVMQSGSPLHSSRSPLGGMPGGPSGPDHQPMTAAERAAAKEARRRSNEARERAHQSTVVKIFVSYVQVLALLQNIPLDIPGVVDVYYRINNQAISYPGILVSLDCSLPTSDVSKAIVRVILTVLAPLYIFAGAVVFFIFYNMLDYYVIMPYYEKKETKKRRKRHRRLPSFKMHMECYLGRHLIVTFITIFFFFYPSVVQALMTIFNCVDVNTHSNNPLAVGLGLQTERVWSQDFSLECYTGPHLALTLGLGVPGVLLIAIGWPVLSALFMTGKLPCMNNIRFTEEMVNFFLADFKRKYAWWESLIMLRKLLIAVIVTLMDGPTSAGVQLLLVVCVLVIAMGIHLICMPYRHLYTNNLELFSVGTLLVTLYFSLYFSFSNSISTGGRITISVLILVVNIAMIIAFVYYIIQSYYYSALYNTGLSELDRDTRRKLTQSELQRRILENLTQPSTTSVLNESAHGPHNEGRTSYHHVASIYAAAVWASMRVGSTTNKVLTRVRTLLPQHMDEPPSRPPSRDGSFLEPLDANGASGSLQKKGSTREEGVPAAGAANGNANDPEAAVGSGGSRRGFSHNGLAPLPSERNSTGRPHMGGSKGSMGRTRSVSSGGQPHGPSGPLQTVGSKVSAAAADQVANTASSTYGSSSSMNAAAGTAAAVAAAAAASTSSMDGHAGDASPRLPTMPPMLEVPPPPSQVSSLSPSGLSPLSPPGGSMASHGSMHRQGGGVRFQSRLAVASNPATRSGEMLPPPPSFPGRI